MHDLDDPRTHELFDRSNMREQIAGLPRQCAESYAAGLGLGLPPAYRGARNVVVAGMGGSGIGGALIQALLVDDSRAPITVWRDYGLPRHASGPDTLVIAVSNSGNTEETLSAFNAAVSRGCAAVAVCTGGALANRARAAGAPLLTFSWPHAPREAVGWATMPVLAILAQLDVIPDLGADVEETVRVLATAMERLRPDSHAARNSAKRVAGQFLDRLPVIYGAGIFAPVARRWKTQLNECAKSIAAFDDMPELNHNTVVGYAHPQQVWQKTIVIALRGPADHPRNSLRFDATTLLMLEAGVNQDTVRAQGHSRLAQQWSLLLYGDWVSYYTAIMAGIDPIPVASIDALKAGLAAIG